MTPILLLLGAVSMAPAAADTLPVARAVRIAPAQRPSVDGRLSELAWSGEPAAAGFVQTAPRPGAPSTQRTEARVLYTDDAVYVGMRMYDTAPDSIAAQLARRDPGAIYSDWAHVVVDSYDDNRTAFRFSLNPRGVKRDVLHFNDTGEDATWDAVWDGAAAVDSLGWTAEFRIPLSQLRFSRGGPDGAQRWGINFGREIARADERAYWAPVLPNSGRFVSWAGELAGLSGLRPPRRLELQPYSVGQVTRAPVQAGNPFYRRNAGDVTAGADVRYGLTSDLTLTATLNPDFGQVEADPSEVNLTAFETQFTERRPFFSEGTDLFSFRMGTVGTARGEQVFYSRRIGRSPQGQLGSAAFFDAPSSTTILGAAKVSGKTAGGWTVGVLNAVTAQERARTWTEIGGDSSRVVEPMANYTVARVSRNLRGGQSAVGALVTSVLRDTDAGEGTDFLHRNALVAGVDARHRWGGGHYEVKGSVLASRVQGSTAALLRTQTASARLFQRPDRRDCALCMELDPERTSLSGAAATVDVTRIGGGHWRWNLTGAARTQGFEMNDLGFQQQADAVAGFYRLDYVNDTPIGAFRNWSAGVNGGLAWTMGGERTFHTTVLQGAFQLKNFWSATGGLMFLSPVVTPSMLRGGPALRLQPREALFFGVYTDPRTRVRASLAGLFEYERGTDAYQVVLIPELIYRPSSRAELSVSPNLRTATTSWQYLAALPDGAGGQRYVGGRLAQTTLAVTARASYAFTPDLSLQLYAQPFVGAGDYTGFSQVAQPRARRFADRFAPTDPGTLGPAADFNVKQLRSNAVLRWEYRPGSTLFVIWSQRRDGYLTDGTFGLGRDFGRLFGMSDEHNVPGTNVLAVKFTYWLDL